MQQHGVGVDRVEGTPEVVRIEVEHSRVYAVLPKPLDEGGGAVGAVNHETGTLECFGIRSRSASEFEHARSGGSESSQFVHQRRGRS